jgi:hypothetical protein
MHQQASTMHHQAPTSHAHAQLPCSFHAASMQLPGRFHASTSLWGTWGHNLIVPLGHHMGHHLGNHSQNHLVGAPHGYHLVQLPPSFLTRPSVPGRGPRPDTGCVPIPRQTYTPVGVVACLCQCLCLCLPLPSYLSCLPACFPAYVYACMCLHVCFCLHVCMFMTCSHHHTHHLSSPMNETWSHVRLHQPHQPHE